MDGNGGVSSAVSILFCFLRMRSRMKATEFCRRIFHLILFTTAVSAPGCRERTRHMKIQSVTDPSFRPYGRVLTGIDVSDILEEMKHTPLPQDAVIYEPTDTALEALPAAELFRSKIYGELPIQIGFCNGFNLALNALEYHRSSEINIAATDLVLLLGRQQDITDDFRYDTSLVEAFLVPAGTAIEVYATTLHYAPCSADGVTPFRCTVILPRETNFPLEDAHNGQDAPITEDRLLAARNKWLIAHKDAAIEGAFCGLQGENITV